MMHEVRSIPPAPRRIRLRPLLAHRWPMLAVAMLLGLSGSLLAWLMFLQSGGKPSDQRRLEQGPTTTVRGRIIAVDRADDRARQQVHYWFDWEGQRHQASSNAVAGTIALDDAVDIVVLNDDPRISAVTGTVLFLDRTWLQPQFWLGILAVPGALLLLGWLAGSFQLRQVLIYGDAAVGTVTSIRRVQLVLPEMLRVGYEFRDHRAIARRNAHWVRVHGELGARLVRQMESGVFEKMPVLHDRRLPQWNRMLLPQDFLPQTTHDALPANGSV